MPFRLSMPHSSLASSAEIHPFAEKLQDKNIAWQRFSVPFEYPVYFADSIFSVDNPTVANCLAQPGGADNHRAIVFIDEGVTGAMPALSAEVSRYFEVYEKQIRLACAPITVSGGEQIKNDPTGVKNMLKVVADHRIDRHSYVIAIGGGALLDAVGLVAATSHRGIRHVRIPTTVLAQNDSGVGVKNGINLFGQKNYAGTFAPPYAVFNDYRFIRTLSDRDKLAGMAEAVKVALIRDNSFYQWLTHNAAPLALFDERAMQYMIRRCAELHMHQIAMGGDPFETGSARPLDYGHWAAHKLESLTKYELRHGEAVAIGLALDTRYSVCCGLLNPGADEQVCDLLENLGFSLWHDSLNTTNENGELSVLQGLNDFREHLGGQLTITLLEDIGVGVEVNSIDHQLVRQAISWLKHRAEQG